jgi:putative glutathione S-transferase
MGVVIDGTWHPDGYESTNDDGEFERNETTFRNELVSDPAAEFAAEPGRYHLYIARACPWAHGAALVRSVTGLDDAISMDIVDPLRFENGWQFTPEKDGCTPDTINGFDYLREVYTAADPDYTGRVTVPVLGDKQKETIVNNESVEIMQMLDAAFDAYKSRPISLRPDATADEIDEIIERLYDPINNGVYRAGFARAQAAYDRAVGDLFAALDHWDDVLADQRYLAGEELTLADLRLFPTLVRFDQVYHTHFKCNVRRILDYDNLWNYTKELYQLPGVAETVNMTHIKDHYYRTHESVNPSGIVARGPEVDFTAAHDRDRLAGGPPQALLA